MKKAKFRGQRIDTKDWIYGNLVIIDDNYYISSKESYFWSHITELLMNLERLSLKL